MLIPTSAPSPNWLPSVKRVLALTYTQAAVDFNVVMTGKGEFVEIQGTAEGKPFPRASVDDLLNLAEKGIKQLF